MRRVCFGVCDALSGCRRCPGRPGLSVDPPRSDEGGARWGWQGSSCVAEEAPCRGQSQERARAERARMEIVGQAASGGEGEEGSSGDEEGSEREEEVSDGGEGAESSCRRATS
eukprot:2786313-Prymnesium_polylepis.1